MPIPETISAATAAFTLVGFAEIGDKSQLVCMALAARYRHWPVLAGAAAAFIALNTLAVLFGAGIAAWLSPQLTAAGVAVLFAVFGVLALRTPAAETSDVTLQRSGQGVFFTTLSLIFLAELGDKTQIAVAGMASHLPPVPVWAGACVALLLVSALGVWVGRSLLQRLPGKWLHRTSGALFLLFAALAAYAALRGP